MTNDELKPALLKHSRVGYGGGAYTLSAIIYRVNDGKFFLQVELLSNNHVIIADPQEVTLL